MADQSSGPIVVGVDGSETALRAAEVAAGLAEELGTSLHVVSAYEHEGRHEVVGVGSDKWYVGDADEATTAAQNAASRFAAGVEVTDSAPKGKPADVLIAEAERLGARMIVVGNHRMQGAGRILGSVANSVAHHAPCDVYIVRTT